MKIAFCIKSLEGNGGGAERVLTAIMSALAKLGHDVTVFTFDRAGFETFYELDHRVLRVGLSRSASLTAMTPNDFVYTLRAFRRHIAGQFDVAVGFMHSTYVPLSLALIGSRTSVISSEHTTASHFKDRRLESILAMLAQKLSFAKTVVSTAVRDEHNASGQKNLVVLPNPVDIERYAPAKDIAPEKVILCVGGFRTEKNQSMLVAAFERIAARLPDWRLRLVGDGPTWATIKEQVEKSNFVDRIEMPGALRNVPAEYSRAALVVIPSHYESLSMVAVEAMASGRPVLAFSDCAGPSALIESGKNGVLVAPGDDREASLAKAIERILNDPEARAQIASNAPAMVSDYSIERIAVQWEALLKSATREKSVA
ncbi:glycosyltransferase [Altererythrobacter luteolus]|uniref:Glycosyltransferase n=1 Tax=Pontixanthobacter luteolus TaxID=295089 RepID=A0A6I4V1C6_9SPHN|nr:glycosyltransferase family 4 protein [Pontixanthobacter luteolus]MXP47947.1 glycosyltransferase [Pontixanthobacter luteolus]